MTSQWQPIETAPKDGSKILLLVHGVVVDSKWGYSYHKPCWEPTFTGAIWSGDATHWMPIPELPQ